MQEIDIIGASPADHPQGGTTTTDLDEGPGASGASGAPPSRSTSHTTPHSASRSGSNTASNRGSNRGSNRASHGPGSSHGPAHGASDCSSHSVSHDGSQTAAGTSRTINSTARPLQVPFECDSVPLHPMDAIKFMQAMEMQAKLHARSKVRVTRGLSRMTRSKNRKSKISPPRSGPRPQHSPYPQPLAHPLAQPQPNPHPLGHPYSLRPRWGGGRGRGRGAPGSPGSPAATVEGVSPPQQSKNFDDCVRIEEMMVNMALEKNCV